MHTYIDISSLMNGLINLVAQLVSILRTKLWGVVFNFWVLLLKMYFFEVATFFFPLHLSNQLNFDNGVLNVKD